MTDGRRGGHLSVVMTTESITELIRTTVAASVSSASVELYFQCFVVVIGVVGAATNALILYAMVASKQHKRQLLIFHQNIIDFISSLLLVITYALKLCNFHLTGLGGYWFCMLVLSENLIWCAILSSKANLVCITIERYLKAVYPVWSKKKLLGRMIYSAMAFAWISGIIHAVALGFATNGVVDGVCYGYVLYESRRSQMAYGILYFLLYYIFILVIFIVCYWRIIVAIRRQARVMASHGGGPTGSNTAQRQSLQFQSNVIKTMILVSAFYAISDLPMNIYALFMNINANLTLLESGYYASMFISFLYFCTNPFIYAIKFDPVKRVLQRLIPCVKTPEQPTGGSMEITASRVTAARTQALNRQGVHTTQT